MDIAGILTDKFPGTLWQLNGDEYKGLEWFDDSPKPTKKTLEALWPEVQQARQLKTIQDARAVAYAQTADPLFFKWQRGEVTEQEWLDAVEAVRVAHPYPEVAE
jgi:hypothetical protein